MVGGFYTIAVAGGECSGKTSVAQELGKELIERGYKTIVMPSAASSMKSLGFMSDPEMFGESAVAAELKRIEDIKACSEKLGVPTVIVTDGGIADLSLLIGDEAYRSAVEKNGKTVDTVLSIYDSVIFLDTPASTRTHNRFYDYDKFNAHRSPLDDAREQGERLFEAWSAYDGLVKISNEDSFDMKVRNAIAAANHAAGLPAVIGKPDKFRVANLNSDDFEKIEKLGNVSHGEIEIYYIEQDGVQIMYRRLELSDGTEQYSASVKRNSATGPIKARSSRVATKDEFYANMPQNFRSVKKRRWSFEIDGTYYNIDQFVQPYGTTVLEVVHTDKEPEGKPVEFPDFLMILKSLKKDRSYTNLRVFQKLNPQFYVNINNWGESSNR